MIRVPASGCGNLAILWNRPRGVEILGELL
jgi:hypothetical protein